MGRKRTANHDLPPRMHPQGRGVLPRHKHHAAQMDMLSTPDQRLIRSIVRIAPNPSMPNVSAVSVSMSSDG